METISTKKLIYHYIKDHIKSFLFYCIFICLFLFVLFLNNLPAEPVLYSTLLCCCVAFIIVIYDFYRYYQRNHTLILLKNNIMLSIEDLPAKDNLIEENYQELITILYQYGRQHLDALNVQSKELTEYVTMWAHQIKTPISAMRILLQSGENPENKQLLMELFKVEQYIEMILQYIRLGSMSSDLLLTHYSLDSLVRQAVRKFSKIFISKQIVLNYDELDYNVLTDEKWLVFVIEQVLSNALKYTKKGSISIYMSKETPKTLIIEDTGIGIPSEDLPRVFEKGFTGYNGHIDKRSTGFGLFLCQQILKKLSHTITVTSTQGKGTKVSIELDTLDMKHID